eukprot:jgi/Chlat1/731/Chrsp104S01216
MAAAEPKKFAFEEVAQHASSNDCWLIVDGKVYDISKFMDEHPGGDEVLLSSTGKDATDDFEDVGHSDAARDMMKEWYIGELEGAITKAPVVKTGVVQLKSATSRPSYVWILQVMLPIAILGLAIGVRLLTSAKDVSI